MKIKPMPIWMSIALFASISIIIAIGLHILLPIVKYYGFTVFFFYYGTLTFASVLGVLLSIFFYKNEKKKGLLNTLSFKQRFWLNKISVKDIMWGIGLTFFWFITLMIVKSFYSNIVHAPDYLTNSAGILYGLQALHNYWIIIAELIFLIINISGEELFWRGYMLPRQEVKHGRKAWVVNGILWSCFHAPLYWIAPTIAPGCIALAFVTQKRKSIWPAIIAHFLLNGTDAFVSIILPIIREKGTVVPFFL